MIDMRITTGKNGKLCSNQAEMVGTDERNVDQGKNKKKARGENK